MRKKCYSRGQGAIEMIFGLIIIVLMVYSIMRAALWSAQEMAQVQKDHDSTMTSTVSMTYSNFGDGPMGQIDPGAFHRPLKLKPAYLGP